MKIDGYKAFYACYVGGNSVLVNEQDQFAAGQKDVDTDVVLTESQASEARTAIPQIVIWDDSYIETSRRWLKKNDFDLIKE